MTKQPILHPIKSIKSLLITGISLWLLSTLGVNAQETQILTLENSATALLYTPAEFGPNPPLLMVLHGMKESPLSAIKAWYRVADKYGYILVAPEGGHFDEGFVRNPIDDRDNFIQFKALVKKEYAINESKSIIAGFSRGGNFAIETGILYPNEFPNTICVFGFFNDGVEDLISTQNPSPYEKSHFYLITGQGDFTFDSLSKAQQIFEKKNIPSQLYIYTDILHQYPPDLLSHFKKIEDWMTGQKDIAPSDERP